MGTVFTIIVAVLVFGFLILIHELGHYATARLFKVTINEFSIGMGPRLISRVSKKTGTRYSVALLPIGGFVAMAGENGEEDENNPVDDPNRFDRKPAWQRFIITAAGASVNIVAGFLAMIIVTAVTVMPSNVVGSYALDDGTTLKEHLGYEVSVADSGLMVGDEIIRIGDKRVTIYDEMTYEVMRSGYEPLDVTVIRGGEEIVLEDVVFPTIESQGQLFGTIDFRVKRADKTLGSVLSYSFRNSCLIVRMVWESLYDLFTGRYTIAAVSGPVGISGAIGDAAKAGFASLLSMVALISINLGVMNLLPIPALDGGRLITVLFEMITRKRVPPKVEGVINAVGLALLLGLSLVIMVKDVIQLII